MSTATGSQNVTHPILGQMADIITTKFDCSRDAVPLISTHIDKTVQTDVKCYGGETIVTYRHYFSLRRNGIPIPNSAVTTHLGDPPATDEIDYSWSTLRYCWIEMGKKDTLQKTEFFFARDLAVVSKWVKMFGQELDTSLGKVDEMLQNAMKTWNHDNNTYGADFDHQGFEKELNDTCEVLTALWGIPVATSSLVGDVDKGNDLLIKYNVAVEDLSMITGIHPKSFECASTDLGTAILDQGWLATRSHIIRAKCETSELYRSADPRPHFKGHPSLVRPFLCFLKRHKDKEQDVASEADRLVDDSFLRYPILQMKLRKLGYSSFREAFTDVMGAHVESDRDDVEAAEHDLEEEKHNLDKETSKLTSKKKKRRTKKKKRIAIEETTATSVPQLDALPIADTSGMPRVITEPGQSERAEGEGSALEVSMAAVEHREKRWLDYEGTEEEMDELVDKWTAEGFLVHKQSGHQGSVV